MGFIKKTWNKITGKSKMEEMQKQMANNPPVPLAVDAGVAKETPEEEIEQTTKRQKAMVGKKGKKGLSIARASGQGINL